MCTEPDDLKVLTSEYRSMGIEELISIIETWEEEKNSSTQLQMLDIAKSELAHKYNERQEQIELLTKSLRSSSRFRRWISSIKEAVKTFAEFKT